MAYDVRQFRPTVYVVVLLGILGYALAAHSVGFCLIGVAGVLVNAWLAWSGRFRPLPRPVANLVTLAAVAYIAHELVTGGGTPVMVVGQFLVILQLVKLYEQRGNRDWAQLLVLSLLLMVAALMNTASMWFGLLLVVYLFLSLYCCLLFHLKVEADAATAALPAQPDRVSPEALRQDQRHLGRSMRRLTGAVAAVGVAFAVGVFVVFPRGAGGMLGPLQQFHANPLTGFSDRVQFQSVAAITQSHERVAFVRLWKDEQLVEGTQTLLLRGLTLDRYGKPPGPRRAGWEWNHTPFPQYTRDLRPNEPWVIAEPVAAARLRQQITLWPTNTKVVFALAGPRQFVARSRTNMFYTPEDGALTTFTPLKDRLEYEVLSTGTADNGPGPKSSNVSEDFPQVYNFARRREVCGVDANGISLADVRAGLAQGRANAPAAPAPPAGGGARRGAIAAGGGPTDLDARIAGNIERYLQTNFSYTLDLTDAESLNGREPLEMFLNTWKKGHCEYFAGAMTLMCQALGLEARMVIGFKCGPENYNDFIQSYTVFDSDAHAWVEVRTPEGWQTFDPTSSRNAEAPRTGFAAGIKHLLEYLEFNYANAVIAYDAQSRLNLITSIDNLMSRVVNRVLDLFGALADSSALLLTAGFALLILLCAVSVGWFVLERWRLLRRAQRIGIESLPQDQRLHLARQLGFYDDLVRLLEQYRIVRPPHFTPLEFSRSLSFLPAAVYDRILRLTRLFYEVRYGGAELTAPRQKRLENVLHRLEDELREAVPKPA